MASKSTLKIRKSLVWETDIPSGGKWHKSSVFTFMNSKWFLSFESREYNGIFLLTLTNSDKINNFLPFDVLTYIEDRRNDYQIMRCSRTTVSSSPEILFKEKSYDIYLKLPKLNMYDDITIICTFFTHMDSVLSVEEREHKSVQAVLDSPSQTQNKSVQVCLDPPSHVENTLAQASLYSPPKVKTKSDQACSEPPSQTENKPVQGNLDSSSDAENKPIQASLDSPSNAQNENLENVSLDTDGNHSSTCRNAKTLDSLLSFKSLSEDIFTLLDKSLMTDVQLICGELTISAHKAILCARSEVFSEAFRHKMAESSGNIVEITDVESHVFDVFLKYLYSGQFPDDLPEDTVLKLYAVGNKYAVHTLKKACSNYMAKNLNAENLSKFFILADTNKDKELKEAIVAFIAKSHSSTGMQENNFHRMLQKFYNSCSLL